MEVSEFSRLLLPLCEADLLTQTRVHRLSSFDTPDATVWLKREDESGFGISGCKKRKYASLMPWLARQNCREVYAVGGSYSNHLPALLQLLREWRIGAHIFLKTSHGGELRGNALLLHLLSRPEELTRVDPVDWDRVEEIAQQRRAAAANPDAICVIPEGAFCAAALPGACTLLPDIVRNETEPGKAFDHLFIDSGSGMTAGALILMNALLGRTCPIHVVLTAGEAPFFRQRLRQLAAWLGDLTGRSADVPDDFFLYDPVSPRSFGSVNAAVLAETQRIAREEGVLTDPVYTTKLLMTARQLIRSQALTGDVLIVHSGGGTGLMGFGGKWG